MKLSPDGRYAHVKLRGALDAAQLDELIAVLADLRSGMHPPVPFDLPEPGSPASKVAAVAVQREPFTQVRLLKDGGLRLWLRSGGLGWLAFDLTPPQCAVLRNRLNLLPSADGEGGADFFGLQPGERGAEH